MWSFLKSYLRGTTWPLLLAMLVLMTTSVLAVRAAELADPGSRVLKGAARSQLINAGMGLAAFVAVTLVHYQRLGRLAYLLFAANIVLLLVVLFLAEDVRGTQRWIDLKFIRFQPSELAKVTYILALAWYLRYRQNYRHFRGLLAPFVLTGIPFVLILLEPALGTSLLLFPTLFVMLFLAGAKLRHLLGIVLATLVLMVLPLPKDTSGLRARDPAAADNLRELSYWSSDDGQRVVAAAPLLKMSPTQLGRIKGWLGQDDPKVARKEGFQLYYSMIILSSSGAYGQRQSEDMNTYYRVLPDDHTDFIYALVGGQWGFIGCAGVLVLYLIVFLCGIEIASITADPFGRLLAGGVVALTLVQTFINVAMTVGMMPITGMTLPLLSFGGSSMLASGLALGLLVNVGQRRPVVLGRKAFEFDGAEADRAGA